MVVSLEDLRKQGWYLTDAGLQYCIDKLDGKSATVESVIQVALNTDLKDIGDSGLPDVGGRIDALPAGCRQYVMQVQRVRNVSAPKDNEDSGSAPPLLKVTLADGKHSLVGLDLHCRLAGLLTTRTPPGTKVALLADQAAFADGYWLADAAACKHLGGRVVALAESWRLRADLGCGTTGRQRRGPASGAAPAFVPFGGAAAAAAAGGAKAVVGNFKSMPHTVPAGNGNGDADNAETAEDEDGEFVEQRRAMIDEARQKQPKKAFATASHNQQRPQAVKQQQKQQKLQQEAAASAADGGGSFDRFDDRSVDAIMNMGYSYTEAVTALRHCRGDLGKAVEHVLAGQAAATAKAAAKRDPDREDRGPIFAGADGSVAKPPAKLSLFDFVQDLPISGIGAAPSGQQCQQQQPPAQSSDGRRGPPRQQRGPLQGPRYDQGAQRGPPTNQRGGEQHQRGPPSNQRGGEQHQRGPPPNQRGGEQHQRGPPPNQRGGEQHQRGPPPSQRGGEQHQRGPPPSQHGGEQHGRGPPLNQRSVEQHQRGPPLNQRGGEQHQRGPPPNQRTEQHQRGPAPNQRDEEQYQRGPPPNQRGKEQNQREPPANQRGEQQHQRGPPFDQRGEQHQRGLPPNQRGEQHQRGPAPNQRGEEQHQRGPPPNQRGGEQHQRGPPPNQRWQEQNLGGLPNRPTEDQRGPPNRRGEQLQREPHQPPPIGSSGGGPRPQSGPPPSQIQQQTQPPQGAPGWCPRPNEPCLARWTDGNHYPAVVLQLQPPGRALICWTEYNETRSLPLDALLPARFNRPPPMPLLSMPPSLGAGGGALEFVNRGYPQALPPAAGRGFHG